MQDLIRNVVAWAQARQPEAGQGVIEYALIIGLVSIVLAGVLAAAGTGWINAVTAEVTDALS
ncbi:MAG: Flp family type IVb pilin [Chloroflexota bacterium]|nr:Flp family type IVb pilin [Dehalococcoidia bacterium]MDW8045854.1 Flp family type IVb pilin [Chloroflexota bacterium]